MRSSTLLLRNWLRMSWTDFSSWLCRALKFNNLRKRDIAAEKGIALSEPGSLGSQPANNVFIRRRGVDIARDFAVDAVKTGELKEVRLLQMDRIFVSIGKRGGDPDSAIEGFAASRTLSKRRSGRETAGSGIF